MDKLDSLYNLLQENDAELLQGATIDQFKTGFQGNNDRLGQLHDLMSTRENNLLQDTSRDDFISGFGKKKVAQSPDKEAPLPPDPPVTEDSGYLSRAGSVLSSGAKSAFVGIQRLKEFADQGIENTFDAIAEGAFSAGLIDEDTKRSIVATTDLRQTAPGVVRTQDQVEQSFDDIDDNAQAQSQAARKKFNGKDSFQLLGEAVSGNGSYGDALEAVSLDIIQSVPGLIVMMGGGVAGIAAVSGGAGANKRDELLEAGVDESTANINAIGTALVEGVSGKITTVIGNAGKAALKKIGKDKFKEQVAKTYGQVIGKLVLKGGASVAVEGVEEGAAQFGENLIEFYTGLREWSDVWEGVGSATLAGSGTGGLISGLPQTALAVSEASNIKNDRNNQEQNDDIQDPVAESESKTQDVQEEDRSDLQDDGISEIPEETVTESAESVPETTEIAESVPETTQFVPETTENESIPDTNIPEVDAQETETSSPENSTKEEDQGENITNEDVSIAKPDTSSKTTLDAERDGTKKKIAESKKKSPAKKLSDALFKKPAPKDPEGRKAAIDRIKADFLQGSKDSYDQAIDFLTDIRSKAVDTDTSKGFTFNLDDLVNQTGLTPAELKNWPTSQGGQTIESVAADIASDNETNDIDIRNDLIDLIRENPGKTSIEDSLIEAYREDADVDANPELLEEFVSENALSEDQGAVLSQVLDDFTTNGKLNEDRLANQLINGQLADQVGDNIVIRHLENEVINNSKNESGLLARSGESRSGFEENSLQKRPDGARSIVADISDKSPQVLGTISIRESFDNVSDDIDSKGGVEVEASRLIADPNSTKDPVERQIRRQIVLAGLGKIAQSLIGDSVNNQKLSDVEAQISTIQKDLADQARSAGQQGAVLAWWSMLLTPEGEVVLIQRMVEKQRNTFLTQKGKNGKLFGENIGDLINELAKSGLDVDQIRRLVGGAVKSKGTRAKRSAANKSLKKNIDKLGKALRKSANSGLPINEEVISALTGIVRDLSKIVTGGVVELKEKFFESLNDFDINKNDAWNAVRSKVKEDKASEVVKEIERVDQSLIKLPSEIDNYPVNSNQKELLKSELDVLRSLAGALVAKLAIDQASENYVEGVQQEFESMKARVDKFNQKVSVLFPSQQESFPITGIQTKMDGLGKTEAVFFDGDFPEGDQVIGEQEQMQGLLEDLEDARLTKEEKEAAKKILKKVVEKHLDKGDVNNAVNAIVENLGKKNQQDGLRDSLYKALGLPVLDGENLNKVREIIDEKQATPGEVLKNKKYNEVLDIMANIQGDSPFDITGGLWFAATLSGPPTWQAVLFGNIGNVLGIPLRAVVMKGGKVGLKNFIGDLGFAMAEAARIFNTGKGFRNLDKFIQSNVLERVSGRDLGQGAVKDGTTILSKGGKYVGRMINLLDAITYYPASSFEASRVAYLAALDKGLKGKELEEYVNTQLSRSKENQQKLMNNARAELTQAALSIGKSFEDVYDQVDVVYRARELWQSNLNEFNPDAVSEGVQLGKVIALANDPEGVFGFIATLPQNALILAKQNFGDTRAEKALEAATNFQVNILFPFMKTVANMANMQLDYVPVVGLANRLTSQKFRALEKGGDKRRLFLAKQVLGTALFLGLLGKVMSDDEEDAWLQISAGGPKDRNKKIQWFDQGNKPWTLTLGGQDGINVNYRDWAIAPVFMAVGAMSEAVKFDDAEKYSRENWSVIGNTLGPFFLNSSMLQTLGDLTGQNSYSDETKLLATLSKPIRGLFNPAIIRHLEKQISPELEDKKSLGDAWYSDYMGEVFYGTPIIRNMALEDKYNHLGQKIVPNKMTNALVKGIGLDRFFTSSRPTHPIYKFMANKGAWFPGVSKQKKLLGEPMTSEQYRRYAVIVGMHREIIMDKDELKSLEDFELEDLQQQIRDYDAEAHDYAEALLAEGKLPSDGKIKRFLKKNVR